MNSTQYPETTQSTDPARDSDPSETLVATSVSFALFALGLWFLFSVATSAASLLESRESAAGFFRSFDRGGESEVAFSGAVRAVR